MLGDDDLGAHRRRTAQPFTLVGTATYGAVDGVPGSSLVATTDDDRPDPLRRARPLRQRARRAAEDGVTPTALADRIVAEVAVDGSGLEALTGEQDTADKQADFAKDD